MPTVVGPSIYPYVSAKRQLELSQLKLDQRELLGQEIDTDNFRVVMIDNLGFSAGESITGGTVSRTIDGASTLNVIFQDRDRYLLRSGRLADKLDIQIEGLWWRLVKVEKSGDSLTLVFEEREIAVLRTYDKFILPSSTTSRNNVTRAEFILRMLQEVKEFSIPYWIPELHTNQPIQSPKGNPLTAQVKQQRGGGINPAQKNITIKHATPTPDQLINMDAMLRTGNSNIPDSNPHKRKLLIVGMMTATQESSFINYPGTPYQGHLINAGILRQDDRYWPASGNVSADSAAFFEAAIKADAANPNLSYNDLAQAVQRSAFPNAYAQWQSEAEAEVNAFGVPGGDATTSMAEANNSIQPQSIGTGSQYFFYRGKPPQTGYPHWRPESTWACIQRLAQEVNWRAFFVSGMFYYMSEDQLFKSIIREIISEDSIGVNTIDGDYDRYKKVANVDIDCQMGLFDVAPGTVVELFDMGPFNGRWLVTTIDRDLFQPNGTITIKKPAPVLSTLEPLTQTAVTSAGGLTPKAPKTPPGTTKPPTGGAEATNARVCSKHVLDAAGGTYRDDNGRQITQWQKAAIGQQLASNCGYPVSLDPRVACFIASLLDAGYLIGTYAICEDHNCRTDTGNPSAHGQGKAVDISTVGKTGTGFLAVNTTNPLCKQIIMEVMDKAVAYGADQVICNGNGGVDSEIQSHQWNHTQHQGGQWVDNHTNHIHVGF